MVKPKTSKPSTAGRLLSLRDLPLLIITAGRLVYLASVKKKVAAKCKKHAVFFNELIKPQTVRLAE